MVKAHLQIITVELLLCLEEFVANDEMNEFRRFLVGT